MKMSDAMNLAGYGGLPNGKKMIEEEKKREMIPEFPDFPYSISRSLEGAGDQEIELAIQVRDYEPPDKRHYYGCEYFPGSVEFGDAVVVATGNTIELTELEWDAIKTAFWD